MLVGKNNFRALEIFLSSFFFSFSISFSFRSKNKAERDAITATSQQTLRNKKKHFVEIFFFRIVRCKPRSLLCHPPPPPPSSFHKTSVFCWFFFFFPSLFPRVYIPLLLFLSLLYTQKTTRSISL